MVKRLQDRWQGLLEQDSGRAILIPADDQPWTVGAVEERARRWTAAFCGIPRVRGRLIGFGLPNGPEWIAVFLAILRSGAVALPLDPDSADPDRLVRSIGGTAVVDRTGLRTWSTRRRPLPVEICLAKLTSGSTGNPVPFFFTHAEMDADGCQVQRGMDIGPADINFAAIPFGHSYGLGNFIMPLLRSGCPIGLGRSILPRELIEDLVATRATVFPAVPPVIRALTSASLPDDQLASVRLVICAGSKLPGEIARRFEERFNLTVHGFYGSTETGGISFDRVGDDTKTERSVGLPLPGVRVARAHNGRLEVSSAAVHSYSNRRLGSSGTPALLLPDHGRILNDGAIALEGRKRGFIKRGGRRISLGEIELVALSLPRVRQAWAFTITRENGEEDLGLALETSHRPDQIRSSLKKRLPNWKRPARLVCLRRFPLTSRGKTDIARLRIAAGT
jgi:acyl-CoA synthetase (AMP-forming)/AMP-acid ligase II